MSLLTQTRPADTRLGRGRKEGEKRKDNARVEHLGFHLTVKSINIVTVVSVKVHTS